MIRLSIILASILIASASFSNYDEKGICTATVFAGGFYSRGSAGGDIPSYEKKVAGKSYEISTFRYGAFASFIPFKSTDCNLGIGGKFSQLQSTQKILGTNASNSEKTYKANFLKTTTITAGPVIILPHPKYAYFAMYIYAGAGKVFSGTIHPGAALRKDGTSLTAESRYSLTGKALSGSVGMLYSWSYILAGLSFSCDREWYSISNDPYPAATSPKKCNSVINYFAAEFFAGVQI